MKIHIRAIKKIENVIQVRKVLYCPALKVFIINYIPPDYFKMDPSCFPKTVLIHEETDEVSQIEDGLHVLEVTAEGILYSIKNEFSESRSLSIYDLRNNLNISSIPTDRWLGYGNSCMLQEPIKKLYIAFGGSEMGDDGGLWIIDLKRNEIIDRLDLGGHPLILSAVSEEIFVKVEGKKVVVLDALDHKVKQIFDVNLWDIRAVQMGDRLVILSADRGIKMLDITRKEITETESIPGAVDLTTTQNHRYLILLLMRKKPFYTVDRLAVFDLANQAIAGQKPISRGGHLKTLEDGRIFFIEILDAATLVFNRVEIEPTSLRFQ